MIHPQLQPYSKTTKWTQGQEGMEMGGRTSKDVWRTQRENYKSTGSFSTKKRGKIQSRDRYIRTCDWRSIIPRTRWKIGTNSFPVKNNATSRTKLRDLWQRVTSNSRGSHKMETISTECKETLWSLDRSWKLKVFQGTSQTEWTTSLVVPKVARLWLYTEKDKHKDRYPFKKGSSEHQRRQ